VELLLRSCITQRRVGKALCKTFSAEPYKATSLMDNHLRSSTVNNQITNS
jgi:hypothetical protein